MSHLPPYLAEIRIMSFNYPPKGWAHCNGQLLPINQNQALFALLGNTYGGDGRVNFALPDLRTRVPIHFGSGWHLGARGGENTHTITLAEMPQHTHLANGTSDSATSAVPLGNVLAGVDNTTFGSAYGAAAGLVAMASQATTATGGSQAHENRQPYLMLNFCICLVGAFPSNS